MATTKKIAAPKTADKPRRPAVAKAVKAGLDPVAAKALAIAKENKVKGMAQHGKSAIGTMSPRRRLSEKTIEKIAGTVTKQAATPGLPVHEVTTTEQLRVVLAEFPTSNSFTTDRKFGKDIITILNMRGRPVAEVHVIPKKAKK